MRCKIFTVPLDSLDQERRIDSFMEANVVKRVFASLANQPAGPVWSVVLFYEGETATTQPTAGGQTAVAGQARPASNRPADSGTNLSAAEVKSIIALKKWRTEAAAQEGVPVYMVAQNRWLEEMVRIPVRTLDDLKKVAGFNGWRAHKYGPTIVEILNTANSVRRSWPTPPYPAGRA